MRAADDFAGIQVVVGASCRVKGQQSVSVFLFSQTETIKMTNENTKLSLKGENKCAKKTRTKICINIKSMLCVKVNALIWLHKCVCLHEEPKV